MEDTLRAIDLKTLLTIVIVLAIEVIGIAEWFKNLIKVKNTKNYAWMSLIILIPCAIMNTTLVPALWSGVFNVVFCGLAVVEICYRTIVQALPNFVKGLLEKGMQNAQGNVSQAQAPAATDDGSDDESDPSVG
jgi:hypothetical protein